MDKLLKTNKNNKNIWNKKRSYNKSNKEKVSGIYQNLGNPKNRNLTFKWPD